MEVENGTQDLLTSVADKRDLGEVVWQELLSGNYENAVQTIKAKENEVNLRNNSLELVPVVAKLLQEDVGPEGEQCVEDILLHIASVANPKEVVLVLLEVLEMKWSAIQVRVMLSPLQTVLLRQASPTNTRAVTFSWVFNTLYSHVAIMETPQGLNLEGKERHLLDLDPLVREASDILQHLTHFYEGIFTRVVSGKLGWGGGKNSREYLALFLLQLFHKPLTYLDVFDENKGDTCNALYMSCGRLASMVGQLLFNVFKLLGSISWKSSKTVLASETNESEEQDPATLEASDAEDDKEGKKDEVSQLSLACFFYCVVGQDMAAEWVPQVYSHQYVFLACLPLLSGLLQEKEHIPIHKGLTLSGALLNKLARHSLPSDSLEASAHSSFPQLLVRVMTFCDNKELRTQALDVFRTHMDKFDSHGRRKLIQALLLSVKHAGVLGLVIHELKENVALNLGKENLDLNFSGRNLLELVKAACVLPEAEQTDLLEWSDCIMAALNLLIFLFIRDKENKTGVAGISRSLKEGYLTQLQTGLDLTKGHYELKLKELSETPSKKEDKLSVCVGGQMLPNLPQDQERKVVETAICSLDMMQCVLVRAVQAIEKNI
ncbi:glomulin-like isoform X1 [Scylla paramamosain]|uniref:glomulin-like isoform X1 n=1 Tax=Scylla paramamosain TaxID=85552 RepID=UPI0030831C19